MDEPNYQEIVAQAVDAFYIRLAVSDLEPEEMVERAGAFNRWLEVEANRDALVDYCRMRWLTEMMRRKLERDSN